MGVTVKTKTNKIPQIEKVAKELGKKDVVVGFDSGEQAWLAGIHEYGLDIEVTPKMRAFMHHMGVHLKKSTTHIHIPERSFLRNGHDEHIEKILDRAGDLTAEMLGGSSLPPDTLRELVGMDLASAIKEYAIDLKSPPNSDLTINGSEDDWGMSGLPGKGGSNPLVATGDMIGSITHKVK